MPEITINHATIGGARLAVVNNRTRDNKASTLLISYASRAMRVRANYDYNMVATLAGFPLSVSLFSDPDVDPSSSINQINNFYALDIIEQTRPDDLARLADKIPTEPSDQTFTWNGNRLSAIRKSDNRYYMNIVNSGNTGNATNIVTLMGLPMAQGGQGELILHKTDYTIDNVDEYKEIGLGGSLLSVGRIGNSYYLIVSPIPPEQA